MPRVDEKLIHALRNVLVHDYGSANGQTIVYSIYTDIDVLAEQVNNCIELLERQGKE